MMFRVLKTILPAILVILTQNTYAQDEPGKRIAGDITGSVYDSLNGRPIEYATITLFSNESKKPVNGTITDEKGHYVLPGVEAGIYQIIVESIGYVPYAINAVTVKNKDPRLVLHRIFLSKIQKTLQNVTVTSSTSLLENKIDKVVFNAEKDITSQGGVATDLLKKIPQVSVDVDGNVELAGNASIRFLINGKPSSAFGSNITDVLQTIPASQIKSIEVITNPGAKYDAQGMGGIINIILKQSKVKGINGNLSLGAGTRNENASFNFNARKNDFGFNIFLSGNFRPIASAPYTSDRITLDTLAKTNNFLQQWGSSSFNRQGMESGFGFDWTLKKKNNFNFSFRYGLFQNSGSGSLDQLQVIRQQNTGIVLSSSLIHNNTGIGLNFYNTDLNLNYKRTFKKEGQELEISLHSNFDNNSGINSNDQYLEPQDSLVYGISGKNPGTQRERILQVDYTQPLERDVVFGFGGKVYGMEINSRSEINNYQPLIKTYRYDTSLSNNLEYKQKVYALYGEISFPVGKIFNAKIGGRYERTENNSYFSNAQKQADPFGYNTFVPSVFFSRNLGERQTLKLSYSKRINRPDYRELNPFLNTTDPKNISAGNPYLQPEIGHRYEMSFSRNFEKAGSFVVTAFYRINDHDIQPFIVFYPAYKAGDSIYTNVAVSTRENIGTEKNTGINAFTDLHFNSKFSIRSNLSFFHRHTVNALDPGYNSNSFNYRFNLNASYQFSSVFAGEFFGSFNSARNEAQGRYPSFTTYSIALRKQFWNKKGSLAISASNPFQLYVNQRTVLYGPNFTVNNLRKVPFRSIGLSFTWKFGKLEFKKEKEEPKDNSGAIPEGN